MRPELAIELLDRLEIVYLEAKQLRADLTSLIDLRGANVVERNQDAQLTNGRMLPKR